MYPICVLVLCLLGVTVFADSENASSAVSITPGSTPTTTAPENNLTCLEDEDCKVRGDGHICDRGMCFNCYECCRNKREDCPRIKCHCHWFLTDEELKIVAQAVLGVAVFVTCVALLSLLWKICARRLRRRRVADAGASLLDDTVSLSSQQIFVVERLRDRPPRYEEAARDFAVEKPPPYTEVVVEELERPPQMVLVGGVPITLAVGGLTARNFAAPPPYEPPSVTADATSSPVPPPVPSTPPVERLRRCVRKVVLIGRLGRRSVTAAEADRGSRPPKASSPRHFEVLRISPGVSSAVGSAAVATASDSDSESESAAGTAGGPREAVAAPTVEGGAAGEEFEPVPGSPTSTTA